MKSCRHNSGVTLVEMVVVVAIISLLVSIVLAAAVRLHNRDNEQLVRSTFSLLDGALEEYYDYTGSFPEAPGGDPNGTQTLYVELSRVAACRVVLEKISGKMLRGGGGEPPMIFDPWNVPVDYRYVAGDNFPRLRSAGPDRIFNTPDDITSR
ncbi:MAG TPA: prepilin-type N-terminal cleavage/methylation domain-containing protein [Sedimentisphaerales bacterium]|nr:prepilin-type N-terminal cleavage/methylation domain-containing protein [Sedimentisphaerales bacterium]